ncbi:MAG: glycosyltransferase [Chloroflexi bacterium]|nr:glycosyltransferase [Chloroflexota bacterium]
MKPVRPTFSIIIPTYNRPGHLAEALRALGEQHYPTTRFEVIVINDGGTPVPPYATAGLPNGLEVAVLSQEHAGPAAARNTGGEQASGRYAVFTDDDCRPAPDWLEVLAAQYAVTPDHLVGGRTVNTLWDNVYSMASDALIAYLIDYYRVHSTHSWFVPTCNLAVPADSFRAIGGFDPGFARAGGEDREFCDRWRHLGGQTTYIAEAIVYHFHALEATSFWRQHFTYGRGAYRFHATRATRGQGRVRPEPARFYIGLVRYPYIEPRSPRALTVSALLGLSQVANAAGFIWEWVRHRV